jgi:hypothetical protein
MSIGLGLAILGTAVTGGGCESSEENREVRLVSSQMQYEKDIPIPEGFGLSEDACEDQSTGTRRLYLRHIYEGEAHSKYAVRKFYREQMPRARWHLVSDGNVKGVYTLRFEKGTEACTIRITDTDKGLGAPNTRIQVIIVQEERGKAPSEVRN